MKHFKNYPRLGLILVMALATVTLIWAGDTKSTQADKTTAERTVSKGKDAIAQSRKASAKNVTVDNAPKTILFFGDSMLDGLYPRLAAYAKANGHTMYAVIWYSSTTSTWGKSDKLKKYIRDLKPDYVFVALGANELYTDPNHKKDAERDRNIKKIIADIGNIPYIWIGPPNWKPKNGYDLNELIAGNIGADRFFYSADIKFPRMKDGAHPTHEAAIGWMDKVIDWMKTHSSHPIKMNKPTEKKARAKRVFVHQPNEK